MRARFVAPLLLVATSVVVTALLLEVGLRLLPGEPPEAGQAELTPEEADLPVVRSVLELARPNQRGLFQGRPYRTNSDGFRGPETPHAKPPGTFRIVVVGDSVTMGSGVREEETYTSLLPPLLEPMPGRRYEALNLGIAGLTARHVMDRLTTIGVR